MGLKFGFLFSIRNPSRWQKPWPQVYDEMLQQGQAAEELGFDSVWMSEHHGADYAAAKADGIVSTEVPFATPEEMRQREGHLLFLGDPGEIVTLFKQRLADVPLTGTIRRLRRGWNTARSSTVWNWWHTM